MTQKRPENVFKYPRRKIFKASGGHYQFQPQSAPGPPHNHADPTDHT